MHSATVFRSLTIILIALAAFSLTACGNEATDGPATDEISDDNPQTYDLIVTKTGNGTGTVTSDPAAIDCGAACSSSYDQGAVVTLNAVADAGSYFGGWSGGGCSSTGQCVLTMNELKNITAAFINIGFASSITQRDITWYFDVEYQYGQFVNGDYFVIENTPGSGVNITAFTPESTEDSEGYVVNGAMINPDPTVRQQGFNEHITDLDYNASLNVAYGVDSENPLNVPAESSIISTIPRTPDSNHSYIKSAEILTVLSEIPPDGSFRPPYAGTDKTITHNKSELDYNILLNVSSVASTPALEDVENMFMRPWIEFNTGPSCTSIHPADNMSSYGRNIAADIGVGALTLNLNYTNAQKETLMIYFTQLGLDNFGIVQNGGEWEANGGQENGRKWPILFAAMVLNDSTMKSIFSKTGDYLYSNGYYEGNQPPDYLNFGEDDQTFYITQRDVDRHHDPNDYPVEGVDYFEEDLELAEWGISHNLTPAYDSKEWDTAYRHTAFTCMSGHALSILMMNSIDSSVKTIWNHDVFFDYLYRFMEIDTANNTFTQNMWDAYINIYYTGPYGP